MATRTDLINFLQLHDDNPMFQQNPLLSGLNKLVEVSETD